MSGRAYWLLPVVAPLAVVCVISYAYDLQVEVTIRKGKSPEMALSQNVSGEPVRLQVAGDRRGHFYVDGEARDTPLRFMVDTGATYVSLRYEDAVAMGFRWEDGRVTCSRTANGRTCGEVVTTIGSFRIGGIVMENVEVSASPPGRLESNLLGMSFLKRLSRFEYSAATNTLTLVE